jgi:hypothetical protein
MRWRRHRKQLSDLTSISETLYWNIFLLKLTFCHFFCRFSSPEFVLCKHKDMRRWLSQEKTTFVEKKIKQKMMIKYWAIPYMFLAKWKTNSIDNVSWNSFPNNRQTMLNSSWDNYKLQLLPNRQHCVDGTTFASVIQHFW